jgi:hypothetical protein
MSRRRGKKKISRAETQRRREEETRTGNIEQCSFFLCASASLRELLLIVLLREPSLAASQRVPASFPGRSPERKNWTGFTRLTGLIGRFHQENPVNPVNPV